MKVRRRFSPTVSALILVSALMSKSMSGFIIGAHAGSMIPFTEHAIADDFDHVHSVYAADVDGDGDMDVLGAAIYAGDIAWWENDGSQLFTQHTIAGEFADAYSVYATDMDGDGDTDVLGAASYDDDITWWENDGDEDFAEHTIDGDFNGAQCVHAADVDGDGDIDVLGAAAFDDDIAWWENDGDEHFAKHTVDWNFNGARAVYATDMDGDGDVDILGTALWADDIAWWENDGEESFAKHTIIGDFDGAASVYAADVDGDGDVDVLGAAQFGGGDVSWWENDGDEGFSKRTITGDFGGAASVYATDVDGDGDVDVLGAAEFVDQVAWWENDGDENFSERTIDSGFDGAVSVYAADLDGDQDIDILGAAEDASKITWWEQGTPVEVFFLPVVLKNAGPPSYPPVLDEISNPGGHYNYTVSWSPVSEATSYTLEEDDNSAFSSPDIAYSGPNTSTSVSVWDAGTYYYRVKARNDFGSSDWSNAQSVVVTVEPIRPEAGHYTGTPSVSFDVTEGQQVCNFDIKVRFGAGWCRIRPSDCADVMYSEFVFSRAEIGAIFTITGTFDTEVHAVGGYRVAMCEDSIVFPVPEGTWEASK